MESKAAGMDIRFLQLLQLTDSAIPIGTLSHSLGLETLAAEGLVNVDSLGDLLEGFLEESLLLEAVFCRAGYRSAGDEAVLRELNQLLSARKPAREVREASLSLGRRFCQLIEVCAGAAFALPSVETHFSIAFGATCGKLDIDEESCVLALLEQSCANILSSLVRLMPLGQVAASITLWELKQRILATCQQSNEWDVRQVPCFTPMLEIASMRHPLLETRLFVS